MDLLKLEAERLEQLSSSGYNTGVNAVSAAHCFKIFRRFITGKNILELGPAEGAMTQHLVQLPQSLTLVEGAAKLCANLKKSYPTATVIHSLFEAFEPEEKFDNILLGHVLEHVADPEATLRLVGEWLSPEGQVLASVPNSGSLHRQAAVTMQLLDHEAQLNATDRKHGHRRVYNRETLRNVFLQSGFQVRESGGYWMKPLSNKQIEGAWTEEMIRAFMTLGEKYPDIAGEIYIIAFRDKRVSI